MALIVLAFLSLVLTANSTAAQEGAALRITVTSEAGLPIAKAAVDLPLEMKSALTDAAGNCVLDGLQGGTLALRVSAEGFATLDTVIALSRSERRSVQLSLARITTEIAEVRIETDRVRQGRVFSRAEIEADGASNLAEFLERNSTVEIRNDGTAAGQTSARIGGSNSNQVLVLLDGRRVQDAGSGEGDLSVIPVSWIEEIAVHRGGRTNLGGEAIGGIIDIRTRTPARTEKLGGGVDAHSTYQVTSFSREGQVGLLSSFFNYTRTQGPGNYRYTICEDDGNDEFTENLGETFHRRNSDVLRDQFIGKLSWRSEKGRLLELYGISDHAVRGMPGYIAPRMTPLARQTSGGQSLGIRHERVAGAAALTLRGSHTANYRHFSDPDAYSLVHESREAGTQSEAELQARGDLSGFALNGGGQIAHEGFRSDQIENGEAERYRSAAWFAANRSLFSLEDRAAIRIEGGVRAERFGAADPVMLPKAELIANGYGRILTSFAIGWGQSYRAPTFYALFWQDDQVAKGNPDLRPEYSAEWTGRLQARTARENATEMLVAVSDQSVEDLIYWERTFDGHWKPFNLKSAKVRTLELEVKQSLVQEFMQLSTAVNWTEARDATDSRNTGGRYLTYRAPRTHRASINLRSGHVSGSVNYRWADARPVLATNSKWLADYEIVDVAVNGSFKINRTEIRPGIQIQNLFDTPYRIIRHAPMPQREIVGSIHFIFSP